MSNLTIGIIGGGQLGSMLSTAAKNLNIKSVIISDDKDAPAQFFADDIISHANSNPLTVEENFSLIEAVNLIEEKKIWDIPVVDKNKKLVGLLHMHKIVKKFLNI